LYPKTRSTQVSGRFIGKEKKGKNAGTQGKNVGTLIDCACQDVIGRRGANRHGPVDWTIRESSCLRLSAGNATMVGTP
jgi:hypothetical protein